MPTGHEIAVLFFVLLGVCALGWVILWLLDNLDGD